MIFVPVFDSSTKLPSGLLDGNVLQMGNYDECLGVKGPSSPATNEPRFTGLYCRVRITELNLPPLTSSLQQFASGEMPLELNRTHVLHYMHLPLQHSLVKSQVRFSQNFDQTAVYVDGDAGAVGAAARSQSVHGAAHSFATELETFCVLQTMPHFFGIIAPISCGKLQLESMVAT